MHWNDLNSDTALEVIKERSHQQPQLIFKHSTRCGTSSLAKNRLERSGYTGDIQFHLLDVISNRALSKKVADDFGVWHESPQVILLVNGAAAYDESHMGIRMDEIDEQYKLAVSK